MCLRLSQFKLSTSIKPYQKTKATPNEDHAIHSPHNDHYAAQIAIEATPRV